MNHPLRIAGISLFFVGLSQASTLVIDTFIWGVSGSTRGYTPVTTTLWRAPIGPARTIGLSGGSSADGLSYFNNSISDGTITYYGTLYKDNGLKPSIWFQYDGSPSYSLSTYSALTLDFSSVTGEGLLVIEMGFGELELPITEAGLVVVPFAEWIIPPDSQASFDSFPYLKLRWINVTQSAGFTLREIAAIPTAVPEPATYATLTSLAVLSTLMFRRPRRHPC